VATTYGGYQIDLSAYSRGRDEGARSRRNRAQWAAEEDAFNQTAQDNSRNRLVTDYMAGYEANRQRALDLGQDPYEFEQAQRQAVLSDPYFQQQDPRFQQQVMAGMRQGAMQRAAAYAKQRDYDAANQWASLYGADPVASQTLAGASSANVQRTIEALNAQGANARLSDDGQTLITDMGSIPVSRAMDALARNPTGAALSSVAAGQQTAQDVIAARQYERDQNWADTYRAYQMGQGGILNADGSVTQPQPTALDQIAQMARLGLLSEEEAQERQRDVLLEDSPDGDAARQSLGLPGLDAIRRYFGVQQAQVQPPTQEDYLALPGTQPVMNDYLALPAPDAQPQLQAPAAQPQAAVQYGPMPTLSPLEMQRMLSLIQIIQGGRNGSAP